MQYQSVQVQIAKRFCDAVILVKLMLEFELELEISFIEKFQFVKDSPS